MKEEIIAKISDLQDGDMKEIEIAGIKILLTRLEGKFYAVGGECSHYGGPLAEGVLCAETVTCPWHHARFNVKTGDLVAPPALDAMTRFDTRVEGENVVLLLPDQPKGRHKPTLTKHNPQADGRTFVILGAGAAGNAAAQQLRHLGFEGRLVLISKELDLPYNRPPLSKGFLSGEQEKASLPLRTADFYHEAGIELLLGREVIRADLEAKTLFFTDEPPLTFDALLVATGGIPRKLQVPGAELKNVFTLRSLADCEAIIAAAQEASQVVIIGASFIGMEAAASLRQRGLSVTVVGPGSVPFERTLGKEIGQTIQKIHQEKGVAFRLGRKASSLKGEGRVQAVELDNGERLPADLVLVGIGVRPATAMLTGAPLNPDGSITVDKYLSFGDGLYAAGDVARFPDWRTGELIRIEHWQLAEVHGFTAARNMAGHKVEFVDVPFFWSVHFDDYLYYVGHAGSWDDIIWHGSPAEGRFVAFYVKGGRVLAAAGIGYDHGMAYLAELIRQGKMPTPEELRRGASGELLSHLRM
ncbi:MAG: FAD-dependent oxidoreductase [Deltaproteobacteria bacterium]|nr:FAD-dependent oxidoreductase [Deltaproteobacteria bacterium]